MGTEFIKKLADRLKKDKKLLFIICLGVSGMLLLLVSGMGGGTESTAGRAIPDIREICAITENDMAELLKTVDGVGKVKVKVSIDSLEEKVIAQNSESLTGEGEQRIKQEYVIIEEGGNENGLTLKIIMPRIRGVAVSCEGGGSPYVRTEVIRLVSTGLGIPVNKVWVSKMR